jgi:hypothetical protein
LSGSEDLPLAVDFIPLVGQARVVTLQLGYCLGQFKELPQMTTDIKIILAVLVVTFVVMLLAISDCWNDCSDLLSWIPFLR